MGHMTGGDLLARVEELIGEQLQESEREFDRELRSWHPYVTDVVAHVTRFRGKRLRPILLLLSARACGGIRRDHIVLAAVVEMIHTATLVHDDVLDEADQRRHVATVNTRWDNETSVLCGDYLFTHAFHLAAGLDSAHACRAIGRATNLVCEGELCQVQERGNTELTEDRYLRIIDGKTAQLCAVSSLLGAHYADAEASVCDAFEEYGRLVGMAFQIADDLLDIVGNAHDTGKSAGADYKTQKLTLPLIRLLRTADAEQAHNIRDLLDHPSDENRVALLQLLEQSEALTYAADQARSFADQAIAQLSVVPDGPARRILSEIAEFSCRRSF